MCHLCGCSGEGAQRRHAADCGSISGRECRQQRPIACVLGAFACPKWNSPTGSAGELSLPDGQQVSGLRFVAYILRLSTVSCSCSLLPMLHGMAVLSTSQAC